jgi:hypothetical protein
MQGPGGLKIAAQKLVNRLYLEFYYTVKKGSEFPVPGRDVIYQTLPGRKYKLFPPRESLVSDIPARDEPIIIYNSVAL